MGCDIHYCLEVKTPKGWLGLAQSCGSSAPAHDRDYHFFSELAGVRKRDDDAYPEPKGLPTDISDLAIYSIALSSWDHSHSWDTLEDFVNKYNVAQEKWEPQGKKLDKAELFGFSWWPLNEFDNIPEVRVVYAFDN